MRKDVNNFGQLEAAILFEAWKRFKELLRRYPHNGIQPWMQLTNFQEGLSLASQRIQNNVVGGSIMNKTTKEAINILNDLLEDANQCLRDNAEKGR